MVTRERHTEREKASFYTHARRELLLKTMRLLSIHIYTHLMALDGVPTGGADGAQHIAKYFMDTLGPNCFEFLWDEGK